MSPYWFSKAKMDRDRVAAGVGLTVEVTLAVVLVAAFESVFVEPDDNELLVLCELLVLLVLLVEESKVWFLDA